MPPTKGATLMKLKGAQIIVKCIEEQGIDTVYGYPGGSVLDIFDALYEEKDKLTQILTCHEQGASHAADGWARATGKTGVVIATSGPGATTSSRASPRHIWTAFLSLRSRATSADPCSEGTRSRKWTLRE